LPGFDGIPGRAGSRGDNGRDGSPGSPGNSGAKGYPGFPGETFDTGYLVVRHSQDDQVPNCPIGTAQLWSGYSFLNMEGNEKSQGQDLGSTGSCLMQFSIMPFLFCDFNSVCHFAERNSLSYWLSTNQPLPMMPVSGNELRPYISRCSVCEAERSVIAIHSQDEDIPECPSGWGGLWVGYSFIMHTGAGGNGGGQALSSPGSCLENFRSSPFIECNGAQGTCHYFANKFSYWMLAQDDQFSAPRSETLKPPNQRQRVSRCQVCQRGLIRRA